MLGEFAPLKSKHDSGVAEANQPNLLNVIANAVKQSLKATQNVIANEMKQSFLHCHCEPKARQSFLLHNNRLPRRYAPRNDEGVASNGLPRRCAPRNDSGVVSAKIKLSKTVQCGRSLFPQCALDATGFLSDVYKRNTRAKKLQADDVQCGKSMIEMLGVLAIIGVLSVGGLAGYSKAMREYYSSQQRYQFSQLFMNIITMRDKIGAYPESMENLTSLFNDLALIPQGLTFRSGLLVDHYGNYMRIFHGLSKWNRQDGSLVQAYYYMLSITFTMSQTKFTPGSYDACKNVLSVVNVMKNEINAMAFHTADSSSWSGGKATSYTSNNLDTAEKIHNRCQTCAKTEKGCTLNIVFKK